MGTSKTRFLTLLNAILPIVVASFYDDTCGLDYKNMTIVNDDCTTIWSITLESSIILLELSIMLLENIYSTGVTHDDRHLQSIIYS
jgi:hypothetical protein